jgi:hypothetical protein
MKNLSKIFANDLIDNNPNLFTLDIEKDPGFSSAYDGKKSNVVIKDIPYISPYEIIDGEMDPDISYKINSYGHRCDEFKNNPSPHILYSGCSNTTGMATPFEINWATMLHNKINNKGDFFRLSYCSGSYQKIILNLFKYFKLFGNPSHLFLLLPNTSREMNFLNELDIDYEKRKFIDNLSYVDTGYIYPWEEKEVDLNKKYLTASIESHKRMFILSYSYLFMLKQYCDSNNIKLIYSTWDKHQSNLLLKMPEFNDMIDIYDDDYYKYIYENKNRKDKYLMAARDGDHLGVLDSEYISNIFYDRYIND